MYSILAWVLPVESPNQVVPLSWWTLLVFPVGVVAGLAGTLSRVVTDGLLHGGTRSLMRAEWRSLLILSAAFTVGGIFTVASLWILQPARQSLVYLSREQPVLFWILVGILSPLTGLTAAKLIPPRFTTEVVGPEKVYEVRLADLVEHVVEHLRAVMVQQDEVWQTSRNEWLIVKFRERLAAGLSVNDYIERFEQIVHGRRDLPQRWSDLCAQWRDTGVDFRASSRVPVALAKAGIFAGSASEVASAAGIRLSSFDFDHFTADSGRSFRAATDAASSSLEVSPSVPDEMAEIDSLDIPEGDLEALRTKFLDGEGEGDT